MAPYLLGQVALQRCAVWHHEDGDRTGDGGVIVGQAGERIAQQHNAGGPSIIVELDRNVVRVQIQHAGVHWRACSPAANTSHETVSVL
ncbi:MAG: hypothetical protein ACFLMY_05170 [Candidatus Brachytrichaceae bacterium NZ_4S206]|jgi:hypothetical protein